MQSQLLGSKFDMRAYLIVAQVQVVGRPHALPENLLREQIFAGVHCVAEFVAYVRELVMWAYRLPVATPKI